MGLRILVDANILLDYLLCREPYDQAVKNIIIACKQKQVSGCIATHPISNMFFILRKAFCAEDRRLGLNFQYKGVKINQIDRFLKFIERIDGIK